MLGAALARLGGLEPPTHRLEGGCSIQLSYKRIYGAGEGNRTLVTSLEGWRSTIELHPHVVGAAGFEPATPWSRTKCATKLRYAPAT